MQAMAHMVHPGLMARKLDVSARCAHAETVKAIHNCATYQVMENFAKHDRQW
jgi:hypothetical protein